jgi:hypothetical protein
VVARPLTDLSGSLGGGPLVAFACGLSHDEAVELKPDYNTTTVEVDNTETCGTQDELLAVLGVRSLTSSLNSLVMWRHAPSPTRLGRQAAARSSPLCVA